MLDLYVLLKISPDSTQEEVEAAYERFRDGVGRYAPGITVSEQDIEKAFPEISGAFNLLRDTDQRALYHHANHHQKEHFKSAALTDPAESAEEKLTFRQWITQAATYA